MSCFPRPARPFFMLQAMHKPANYRKIYRTLSEPKIYAVAQKSPNNFPYLFLFSSSEKRTSVDPPLADSMAACLAVRAVV